MRWSNRRRFACYRCGAALGVALEISGAVTGGISLIGNIVSKKAATKAEKHLKISERAITKLDTIASHISKALMDDFVSPEEFNLILEEMNKYKALKEEIRSNNKKKLKKEEEESLIEKGRQEARASFRSWSKRIINLRPFKFKAPRFRCRCVCEIGEKME